MGGSGCWCWNVCKYLDYVLLMFRLQDSQMPMLEAGGSGSTSAPSLTCNSKDSTNPNFFMLALVPDVMVSRCLRLDSLVGGCLSQESSSLPVRWHSYHSLSRCVQLDKALGSEAWRHVG